MEAADDLFFKLYACTLFRRIAPGKHMISAVRDRHRMCVIRKINLRNHFIGVLRATDDIVRLVLSGRTKMVKYDLVGHNALRQLQIGHCHLLPVRRKRDIEWIATLTDRRLVRRHRRPIRLVQIHPGHRIVLQHKRYHTLPGNACLQDRNLRLKITEQPLPVDDIDLCPLLLRDYHCTVAEIRNRRLHAVGHTPLRISGTGNTGNSV